MRRYGCKTSYEDTSFTITQEKIFEPLTDTIKITSENLTKTLTESSIKNNQTPENINEKFLEVKNDGDIIPSYLLSLSKITNPENFTQFELVETSNFKRVINFFSTQYSTSYFL